MVITGRFAWAHLPKCGGDATARMFGAVPGLVEFADLADSDDKHLPFFAREAEIGGRLRVMNIRRLPDWVLSAAQHRARHGLAPDYRPQPLAAAGEMTETSDPDDLLRWMTDHDRLDVQRWLRVESLERDVLALLEEVGALDERARAAVHGVGRVNVGAYRERPEDVFTPDQIARLYELNPRWAEIERSAYDD
jgi:hypothetical protein